jgi:hypothetical protein
MKHENSTLVSAVLISLLVHESASDASLPQATSDAITQIKKMILESSQLELQANKLGEEQKSKS